MDPSQTTPPHGDDPGTTPPPNGGAGDFGDDWDWTGQYMPPPRRPPVDFSALLALLDGLRRLIPPELQEQFNALQRELLMTLRALIDWYLERLDARNQPVQIEDIPIE